MASDNLKATNGKNRKLNATTSYRAISKDS